LTKIPFCFFCKCIKIQFTSRDKYKNKKEVIAIIQKKALILQPDLHRRGAPKLRAEITPIEPGPGNAG